MQGQSKISDYYEKEWAKLLSWFDGEAYKPNDEAVLQGCAWLSAQIHRRIDQTPYVLHEQLLDVLFPCLIQDIPAYTMACYERQGARSGDVPRGDLLKSCPLDAGDLRVHFQTTAPLLVHDLHMTDLRMNAAHELVLTLTVPASMAGQSLPMLSIYFDQPFDKACMSYYMFNQQIAHVHATQLQVKLPLRCESAPMTYLHSLGNKSEADLHAYQYLADYFVYPQKYLMVALFPQEGQTWVLQPGSMILNIVFHIPWSQQNSPKLNDFKLNAVPICNRYEQYCEPIRYDHKQEHYSLVVDRSERSATHILSLKSVVGRVHKTGEIIDYCSAKGHHLHQGPYYIHEGQHISCHAGPLASHTLSVLAWVCQGNVPYDRLFVEPLARRVGLEMKVTTLHRPTRLIKRPTRTGADLLLNQIMVATQDLSSVSRFTMMLRHFNRSNDPAHERRIQGIQSINISTRLAMQQGKVIHERVATLMLDEQFYSGKHDAYLFGTVLQIFFTYMNSASECVSLVATLYPSMEVLRWKPLTRMNTLILS